MPAHELESLAEIAAMRADAVQKQLVALNSKLAKMRRESALLLAQNLSEHCGNDALFLAAMFQARDKRLTALAENIRKVEAEQKALRARARRPIGQDLVVRALCRQEKAKLLQKARRHMS